MKPRRTLVLYRSLPSIVAIFSMSCGPSDIADTMSVMPAEPQNVRVEPLQPLPPIPRQNPALVRLGGQLFHDVRLSGDNSLSCHSCHNIADGGDDNQAVSTGINGAMGPINAPTVLNSGLNIAQFWDGRAATLEEQVNGPVNHPGEMGSTWEDVEAKLAADPSMVEAFGAVLDGTVTSANIQTAIAAYERTLQTPNSRFDLWLRGDDDALTTRELRGYTRFKELGCVACHQGRNVGGNMYQTFGVMGDYFGDRGNITDVDMGRFAVTGDELDRHRFRVPSLRNIELTAPYFHDASATDLPAAIRTMALYQLGRSLDEQDVDDIAAFLGTLTGEIPSTEEYLP